MESGCFGIPHGGAVVYIAIGVIIMLWGLIAILRQAGAIPKGVEVWPIVAITFGILIVVGALYGLSRRH
jgi:hypothetical protein